MGRHEAEHLRRFLDARARGDAAAMRRWWEEVVIDLYDRVDGLVVAAHRGRLDAREHEAAVALSLGRISERLIHSFSGTSMGELVNATATLARGICIDVQRASVRRHRHEGPSLDAGWDADAEDRPIPSWEGDEATRRFEAADRGTEARAFLDWALPQLQERRRAVVELTLHGAELPEIMRALGVSRDNAYQLRSRGLKDLKQLKERFDA